MSNNKEKENRLTPEQYIKHFLKSRAEIIAKFKAKGWYYSEMETQGERHENGKDIYTTFGELEYYFLKCAQFGIEPKCISVYCYEALGDGFTFNYCEHSITLAIESRR